MEKSTNHEHPTRGMVTEQCGGSKHGTPPVPEGLIASSPTGNHHLPPPSTYPLAGCRWAGHSVPWSWLRAGLQIASAPRSDLPEVATETLRCFLGSFLFGGPWIPVFVSPTMWDYQNPYSSIQLLFARYPLDQHSLAANASRGKPGLISGSPLCVFFVSGMLALLFWLPL